MNNFLFMFKKDFPIFENNSQVIFLDSASSAQKPQQVIDAMSEYFSHNYANIHRGAYDFSMNSSVLYDQSKQKLAQFLWAHHHEIVYTYNATYALNLIARSFVKTRILQKGDTVLLSGAEHHANIVPWQILAEEYGIFIEWCDLHQDGTIDYEDLASKIPHAKVISLTGASNVTGEILDLDRVTNILKNVENKPLFVMDGSQRFPHLMTDVKKYGIDIFVGTGHKVMTDTGFGFFYARKDLLKQLEPAFCGGGAINGVTRDGYSAAGLPFRHEPGTPHIAGAVSLLHALMYIESIGGYDTIESYEKQLTEYALQKIRDLPENIHLIGARESHNRLGVFSFYFDNAHPHDIAEELADMGICVRSGHHCAEPLHHSLGIGASLRASLYIYNTQADIDIFFAKLTEIVKKLNPLD